MESKNNLESYHRYESIREFLEPVAFTTGAGALLLCLLGKTDSAMPLCIATGATTIGTVVSAMIAHHYFLEHEEEKKAHQNDIDESFILEKEPEFAQSRTDFVQRIINLDEYITDIRYPGYQTHLQELLALVKEYQKDGDYRVLSPLLVDIEQRVINAAADYEVKKESER